MNGIMVHIMIGVRLFHLEIVEMDKTISIMINHDAITIKHTLLCFCWLIGLSAFDLFFAVLMIKGMAEIIEQIAPIVPIILIRLLRRLSIQ